MAWFGRKTNPIREQERELNARLAELQSQIASLNELIQHEQAQPKLRSTAQPHSGPYPAVPSPAEPTFEAVSHQRVTHPLHAEPARPTGPDLDVGKPEPFAVWRRWWRQLRGVPAHNPTLVRYLAAGNVQGLRPLRYEKRVARNRFFMLLGAFLVILYGLLYWYRNFL